jgi:hypothetical protein
LPELFEIALPISAIAGANATFGILKILLKSSNS